MLLPIFPTTIYLTNIQVSQCGHHFSLPPFLSIHASTFLFRRAPLVPGTASHTRLMASLEGGQEEDEAKIVIFGINLDFIYTGGLKSLH